MNDRRLVALLGALQRVRASLTPDLLKPEWRARVQPGDAPSTGHCYAASEALYHLGANAMGYRPCVARILGGGTHWFLRHPTGLVLDPTEDQFPVDVRRVLHETGRGCGFLTRKPSKRAAEIIRRATL